jgi:transposase
MIPVPSGVRVWLAVGHTDMRRGMNGLALQVQEALGRGKRALTTAAVGGTAVWRLRRALRPGRADGVGRWRRGGR